MKTITTEGEAHAAILDILANNRPTSAGNIARKMMGVGLLAKEDWSYTIVREALASLHAKGLVENAVNGKSVHWRLSDSFRSALGAK